ncbi:hybrid cluster protein [Desulfonatronospira thiodismutans ASO3-1]|uniref:Hydroxylamine reductase n=1 Tax=Desulfonatronospira thiodismutans ASO3-1 TaxID=555779 RepID=D6SLN3_9BACT|nr:hydroxylamine reductase [Desulfonatronospira thiodismutans]EFI35594.1 hybrid cluster protein [Desulfonatronospira thiodismutans ASO3-1]
MFCYQCEQTAKGEGCTKIGVCGKQPDTAELQDLLVFALKGLSQVAMAGREKNVVDTKVGRFISEAMFSTLTNVNFDPERIAGLVKDTVELRDELKSKVSQAGGNVPASEAASFVPENTVEGMVSQGEKHGVVADKDPNEDIHSLKQTVTYGIKGICAYADHAAILGQEDDAVYEYVQRALASTLREDLSLEQWIELAMECGRTNIRAMELLDAGNTGTYGHPEPTKVPLGPKKGKAILVSGHDLKDLEMLLKQTEGKGINIYTHGEMLPCHGYPELKKYSHFHGHYGTAWQNQRKEFSQFPGPILMTTNCIQKPQESYKDRIFTTGLVGWPGVAHVNGDQESASLLERLKTVVGMASKGESEKDFSPVIDKALSMDGFAADEDKGHVMVGFGRNAVMSVAGTVIDAVKDGNIRHFFLVGGCDGAKPDRNYYTEFVEKVPGDCVVLTLACGKFRFFDKDLGEIGGIPRLLDVGQCNDAYSAVKIAMALAEAFECGVNDLPLSLVLSWYEQKAVAILLSLLALGVKDIRLGPSLPAFVSPNVLNYLVENYDIKPIKTPDEDLKAILG